MITFEITPNGVHLALENLAQSLETPLIPGELETWIIGVRDAAARLEEILCPHIEAAHEQTFNDILEEDPESHRKVEQLKKADERSVQWIRDFRSTLARLAPRVAHIEPHEAAVNEQTEKVVEDGLALVIHVQKQELAMRVWLQEAFDRERGVGD